MKYGHLLAALLLMATGSHGWAQPLTPQKTVEVLAGSAPIAAEEYWASKNGVKLWMYRKYTGAAARRDRCCSWCMAHPIPARRCSIL